MSEDIKPYLFNIMKDPSVLGGPKTYSKIVTKNNFKSKYSDYISKQSTIPFNVYYSDDEKRYLFHFQVVSSSNSDVIYDVVLDLYTTNNHIANSFDLKEYNVRFFSNSPGFMFTYAYVYNNRKLLVPELINKFDVSVREEEPSKSNPTNAVGFDYTIFFCMYFLYLNDFYMRKDDIKRRGKPFSKFNADDILSSFEVFQSRTNTEKSNFRKLKSEVRRDIRNATHPVRNVVNKVTNTFKDLVPGFISHTKVVKPINHKATRSGVVKGTRTVKKK